MSRGCLNKCFFCTCNKKSSNSAKDRYNMYLKELKRGTFEGTWNEYQSMCKQERLKSLSN